MAAIKIDDIVVSWSVGFEHAAKIEVYSDAFMPFLHSRITANGTLSAATPLAVGAFSIGAISAGAYPDVSWPYTDKLPFEYTLTYPTGLPAPFEFTSESIRFGLPVGVHVRPNVGQLVFTALCEVWADLIDIGDGFCGFHHDGFQRDMPDRKTCKIWLKLAEVADWALTTSYDTYTGTCGTVGQDFINTLACAGAVTAVAGTESASGQVSIGCSLSTYLCDGESETWSEDGGTCTGSAGNGTVEATASPASAGVMSSSMSCTWCLGRNCALECAVLDPNSGGIAAGLAIARYGNDTQPATVTCDSGGEYNEGITHKQWTWSFSAFRIGGGSYSQGGNWTNWGKLAVGLNPAWSVGPEYQDLPDEFAGPVYSPYLNWHDNRLLMKLWHTTGPSFAHASMSSLGLGWSVDGYTPVGAALEAVEPNRYGRWTIVNGTMVDNTTSLLLVPASGEGTMTIRRTLEWSVDQTGGSPTRSPRPTFAGYRYLYITLKRTSITPIPGDTVTVRIRQDDMAGLFPDPALQTWDNAGYRDKTFTGVVNSSGVVVIDLARPQVVGLTGEGDNPPPTGNYGELAHPNTLSRWPQPTMDGNLSGVTVPMWVEIEMPNPAGDVWELGSMELGRQSEPVLYILPALNQWIREERHDLAQEGDTTKRKHWRRRLVTGVCDGLPNLELFDMVRTSSHMVSEELGEYDIWEWTLHSVGNTAVQAVEVHEHEHWEYGTPDTYTPVGALERWPGWSASMPTPASGSLDEWVLAGEGCRMGAHGVVWIGSTRAVQSGIALGTGTKVQNMADELDWFGGLVDPFNMGDTAFTLRAATVLHGLAVGAGIDNDDANICTVLATIQSFNTGADGSYVARNPGGCHGIAHKLVRHGRTLVQWEPQVIDWTFRPSLYLTAIYTLTEAPLWWHGRGVHVGHWWKLLGPPWIRHDKQGRILCQRAEFEGAGLCLQCRQGPGPPAA